MAFQQNSFEYKMGASDSYRVVTLFPNTARQVRVHTVPSRIDESSRPPAGSTQKVLKSFTLFDVSAYCRLSSSRQDSRTFTRPVCALHCLALSRFSCHPDVDCITYPQFGHLSCSCLLCNTCMCRLVTQFYRPARVEALVPRPNRR